MTTPHRVAAHVATTNTDELHTGSAWLMWLLGNGFEVRTSELPPLGYSRSLVAFAMKAMKRAGWTITYDGERTTKHGGDSYVYRATHRPDGTEVERRAPEERPPLPLALVRRRDAADSPTARDRKALVKAQDRERKRLARTAAKTGEVVHVPADGPTPPRPGLLKLIREMPDAPPVGTPLRVGMVAENNGHVLVALHDERNHVWFARLENAPT